MAPRLPSTPKASRKGTLHLASSNGAATPNPRAVIGDNAAAIEEAERIQFISFVSKYSLADDAVDEAKVPFEAAKKKRVQLGSLINAAGFKVADVKKRLAEMKQGTRETAKEIVAETKQRRWLGIVDADQHALMLGDKAPEEEKDAAHWSGEGYKAGLRQMSNTPPTECPTRHHQAYMKAHERGHLEVLTANAPKQSAPTPDPAKDFQEDHPDIDVAAEARKLKNSAFMERGGPDAEPEAPDDGFEASAEELAAQAGRAEQPQEDVV